MHAFCVCICAYYVHNSPETLSRVPRHVFDSDAVHLHVFMSRAYARMHVFVFTQAYVSLV
jgi:hypothetical protein